MADLFLTTKLHSWQKNWVASVSRSRSTNIGSFYVCVSHAEPLSKSNSKRLLGFAIFKAQTDASEDIYLKIKFFQVYDKKSYSGKVKSSTSDVFMKRLSVGNTYIERTNTRGPWPRHASHSIFCQGDCLVVSNKSAIEK